MPERTDIHAEPTPSLVSVTHAVYALHTLSILIGVTTAATIIGAFVFGVPSIIAVVINYLKRDEAQGTFLATHFRWQIRTFWFALLWFVIGAMVFATFVGAARVDDFLRRWRLGDLPDRARLARAAKRKADVRRDVTANLNRS